MKKFKFTIQGNDYEVEVKDFEGNQCKVEVNGTCYEIELHADIDIPIQKTPTLVRPRIQTERKDSKIKKSVSSRATQVKAPLPGIIVKILKNVGDEVAKGETLLVMEAMKMENNILAEKDGTVTAVKISAGDNVLQNDVLVEIE